MMRQAGLVAIGQSAFSRDPDLGTLINAKIVGAGFKLALE